MSDPPQQQRFDFGDDEEAPDGEALDGPATPARGRGRREASPPGPSEGYDRPAPVVTEDGEYWYPRPDAERAIPRELRLERWLAIRNTVAWIAAVALVAAAAAALVAHSVAQATSDEVARPALRSAVDAIAEPEALIDLHFETLRETAAGAGPGTPIPMPGYAVLAVALTQEEAASGDRARMRDALLERSVTSIRTEGRSAFAEGGIAPPVADRLSTAGAVAVLLDGLTLSMHERWREWSTRLVVLAAVLGAAVLALPRGFGGVLGLGAALLASGLLVAVGSLGLRLALSVGSVEGPLLDACLQIAQDLALIPLRNGIVLAAAGAALVLPATLLRAVFERSELRRPTPRTS